MEQRRSVCTPQTDMLPDNIFHRRRRRARSSSANCRRERENTISAKTTKQNFYRRHSYVSSPFFRTENSRAEKSISPSNIERSSRTSNIAIAKRQNLRDGTSNKGERPPRETGSNSSRSTLRCQSACRSTSRSSCSSSRAFNINRRRSSGHERKKEKDTRVKSATFYGEIVNSNGRGNEGMDTEYSRCRKMKNIKRVNNDGENNVSYGGGDGKEEDIIQLEKRLNSIRRLTRDLEIELQCRRDEITGHDGHCSDSRNCGDLGNDVDNTSLLTLRLSNRCIDKDNANSNDYKSQVINNGDDKRIDKPNLVEPTINAPNHISHSSKNAPVPKNTKERKRNTYFGRHPESQQHAASQTPSKTPRPQLDWRYSRRASTGGVLEDYLSISCQPKNPASPFQEFKDEKTSIFLKHTCDADTVSSLSYSSDGNNNKNSILTTSSKFQENKESKDRLQCSDLVQVGNCQGKESQATVYSSPLYSKIERCLNDHASTLLLTEKNNLKTTATSAIDILPSSVINRAHPPPPPPRTTAPSTSSTPPPSSLSSSLSAHCSSQKSPHFSNPARATDNDSDPTASTSSSTANSSNLSRPSTPTECIPFIQTFQTLHQNTLMGSNLGGNAQKVSVPSILSPGVNGFTRTSKRNDNGAARTSSTRRLSVSFQHPLEEIVTLSETEIKSNAQRNSFSGREKDDPISLKLHQRPLPPFSKKESHFPPPRRDRVLQFQRSNSMDSKLTHSNDKSNCNKGREDFAFVCPPPPPPRQRVPKFHGTQLNSFIKMRDPSGRKGDDSHNIN